MTTATQSPAVERAIDFDLPCVNCGYDLRGLSSDGRCPECGIGIKASLIDWQHEAETSPDILRSDPRWRREIFEALAVALLIFVLMLALAEAPPWWFAFKSPQRRLTLGVACAVWILSWFSAWKLSSRPLGEQWNLRSRRILRISATAYFPLPLLVGLNDVPLWIQIMLAILFVTAGALVSSAWFRYTAALLRRCQRMPSRAVAFARVLSVILSVYAILPYLGTLMPQLDGPEDSLSNLLQLHTCQYGAPDFLREALREISSPRWAFIILLGFVLPGAGLIVTVVLLIAMWRVSSNVAATSQKTPANSAP